MREPLHRRSFVTLLGGAAAAWPVRASGQETAQQTAPPLVGYLATGTPNDYGNARVAAFRKGLADMGFLDGRNYRIDIRWMNGDFSRLPELTADLLRQHPAVMHVGSPSAVRTAMAATKAIPIVFTMGEDPVDAETIAAQADVLHPSFDLPPQSRS